MLEGVSTSDLLMYVGIFVLALALIVLVLWVSRISSKMTAMAQALMVEQRKLEEIERQLGIEAPRYGSAYGAAADDAAFDMADVVEEQEAPETSRPSVRQTRRKSPAASVTSSLASFRKSRNASSAGTERRFLAKEKEVESDDEYADEDTGAIVLADAQSVRQQEQMQRISRARERQAMLRQKHSDEMSAELRRKREIARQREEQVRSFQKQQEALRQRIALEQAEIAAEEERLNKLRTRASWSGSGAASARPRQRVSTARLEERRQAQLRKQAEEILQTRLGNAGEMNNFGNSVDFR